jgi:hypothetical protein
MASTRTRAPAPEEKTRENGAEIAVEAPPEAPPISQEELEGLVHGEIEAAYDQALSAPETVAPEIAEVQDWWDIAAFGPIQAVAPGGPLVPHSVIKVGEQAFVFAIIVLNPFLPLPGGTNPAQVLSNFALPYEVQFQTGNLTAWTIGQPDMQSVQGSNLTPGPPFTYFEVIGFTAVQPGLYEMNITARLKGAAPPFVNAPLFGARATTVGSLDPPGLFGPAPPVPLRFSIYP